MSKSTPISQLQNLKQTGTDNAYEEKENQIVSEILNEIDNSTQEQEQPPQNVNMEIHEQQMPQMVEDPINLEESLDNSVSDGLVSGIIDKLRMPLIVAVVVAVVSIPKVSEVLLGVLSNNSKLAAYSTLILIVVKALLASGLFYGITNYV